MTAYNVSGQKTTSEYVDPVCVFLNWNWYKQKALSYCKWVCAIAYLNGCRAFWKHNWFRTDAINWEFEKQGICFGNSKISTYLKHILPIWLLLHFWSIWRHMKIFSINEREKKTTPTLSASSFCGIPWRINTECLSVRSSFSLERVSPAQNCSQNSSKKPK